MSDLAALGLKIESDGVLAADIALDRFVKSADSASASADKVGAASQRSNRNVGELGNSVRTAEAALAALALAEGSGAQRAMELANSTQRASAGLDAAGSSAGMTSGKIARLAEGYDVLTGKMNANFLAIGRNLQNIGELPGEVNKVSQSLKFGGIEALNFSRQLADIGVTAASGMNPLMIALQQGPQLFDILQNKAVMTGATIGAVAKAAGAQIYAAIAPLLPIIAAIALAAATIGAGFALGAREINKGSKSIADDMGLTEKQLARVKKAGVDTAVTMGDTFFAFFEVVGDRLTGAFDGPLKWLKDAWNSALDFITSYGAKAIEYIVGGFVGAVYAIKAAWKTLPAALGEIVISAANATLAGIEWMINKTVDGLNKLVEFANSAAAKVGLPGLGTLEHTQLGRQDNPYAGQTEALSAAVSGGFRQGLADSKGMMGRFWADVDKEAKNNARARITKAAGDAAKTPKGPKSEAEKFSDLTAEIERQIAMLNAQAKALTLSDDEAMRLTNQQKLLNDAQAKGIHLTDQQRQVLMGLAESLTQAQIALRKATNLKAANDSVDSQMRALRQGAEAIGVYGKDLAALTTYQALLNKATNNGKDTLDEKTDAQLRANAADIGALQALNESLDFIEKYNADMAAKTDAMKAERGELGLSGAALYAYRIEQEKLGEASQRIIDLAPDQLATIKNSAAAYGDLRAETDQLLLRTEEGKHMFSEIADAADAAATAMSDSFGRVGGAIGDLVSILADYGAKQEAIRNAVEAGSISQAQGARDTAQAQVEGIGQALGAAKNLFKENSKGYKAMEAAEKAFAVVQLANTAVNIAAGAAKMFASLGPLGFPAVAAMVAVMAGLGAAVSGGGGGYKPPTAEDVQAGNGAGSVLGDAAAKSGSISGALDVMLKNTNKDLEYSNQMVKSLRAIETNIGALTGLLARQLNVSGGAFDQSQLGLGKSTSTGFAGKAMFGIAGLVGIVDDIPVIGGLLTGIAKALFGTKKTVTLLDQGISFANQTVEDIINGGAIGQIYQDVQTQTKKKFLGVTTSNKTKVSTDYSDLDSDMEKQVALIIGSLKSGIIDAAGILGVNGAGAALNAFNVNLGKISLKDLKGDEIQAALESVFSKLGDDMAHAVLPGLDAFQRVGEGVFETLSRLASDYASIDTALTAIGMTFGSVGLASVEAREGLLDLFGGLDAFTEQTNFFRETFLTEAEQMAPIIAAVSGEMARLGQTGVVTNDQFKSLVLGLDLSTSSGAEMYASLMAVAPAFAKVNEYLAGLNGALVETGQTAEQIAAEVKRVADERAGLEAKLLQATGDTNAIRAAELAQLDATNRPLQERLYALEDEATALAKVKAIADERAGLESRLLQINGDTVAIRALELAALDPSNRALQQLINTREDEIAAAEKATEAHDAEKAASMTLTEQRRALYIQITELTDTEAARKIALEDELRAADASLVPLILRRDALEKEAAAAVAAAQAAEALAAKQKAIADERYGLDTQWYQLVGDTAKLRERELALLDPTNRALQQQIYTEQDRQAAVAAAEGAAQQATQGRIDGINAARDALSAAYERESGLLQGTADKMRDFASSIREFREGLFVGANPTADYNQARSQFLNTSRMAALGNEASLGNVTNDAQKYLELAKSRSGSAVDYQREVAMVARELMKAENGANALGSQAERQIAAMDAQIRMAGGIDALNEKQISFTEALNAYTVASQEQAPVLAEALATGLGVMGAKIEANGADAKKDQATQQNTIDRLLIITERLQNDMSGAIQGGALRIRAANGDPLPVTGSVTINNTAENPAKVHEVAP